MTALALAGLYRRWLGGATGDCLGAATEVGETVSLLVAVAVA
jgi:cobalamin synthase